MHKLDGKAPLNTAEISVKLLGIDVAALGVEEALALVERLVEREPPALVAFANAHTLNLAVARPRLRRALESAAVVFNDGIGLQLAARMRGTRFPANLNGSDFVPRILGLAASRRWRVFFLGAAPGVAAAAAAASLDAHPGLVVGGSRDGYFADGESKRVADEIRATRSDVLLVAMGNPRQEIWLDEWLDATGARLGVGVGAFFDFSAGRVRRAPAWMNRVGAEWLFRLAQEPRRLGRRYLIGMPLFLVRAAAEAARSRGQADEDKRGEH
jgi:exopolysaccharide biosynthesis WecB/TagA/CpsF family protein